MIRTAGIWAAVTGGVSVVGVLIQYPFLDVAARGVGPVAITCEAIALLLVGLAWPCGRLDRVLRARPTPDARRRPGG